MVEITFSESKAQIDWGSWTSEDPLLLAMCEAFSLQHPYQSVPSNPDPDYDVAQFVAKKLGGTITHADEPDYVEGRVY